MLKKLFPFILLVTPLVTLAQPMSNKQKTEGLLIGSMLGDAAGGPPEFVWPVKKNEWSTNNSILNENTIEEIGLAFGLSAYKEIPNPYGPWLHDAPPGTITDDSRFKIIFINSIKKNGKVNKKLFAKALLEYSAQVKPEFKSLADEWMQQFIPSALYVVGKKNDSRAKPPETIWAGVPTNLGQMAFLPVAALHPNQPEAAYLKTWEVDYFDFGFSKDMHASLVAGLSHAYNDTATWKGIKHVMKATDPFEMNKIPWAKRRTGYWITFAEEAAKKSGGNVAQLFAILERDMQAIQWWDTWVPMVIMISIGEITNYHPLATMQLANEFGYDTDSYLQLIGAFMGILHGPGIFSEADRKTVEKELREQYDVKIKNLLQKLGY